MFLIKIIISACIISIASWLSGQKSWLAGFIVSLPITSMLALAFGQIENQSTQKSFEFAKSIFVAVPLSLVFFIPFLFAPKFNFGFWQAFGFGILGLFVVFLVQQKLFT